MERLLSKKGSMAAIMSKSGDMESEERPANPKHKSFIGRERMFTNCWAMRGACVCRSWPKDFCVTYRSMKLTFLIHEFRLDILQNLHGHRVGSNPSKIVLE